MKLKYVMIAGLSASLLTGAITRTAAQSPAPDRMKESMKKRDVTAKEMQVKTISEEDKAALKEIFKDVDPKAYRLEFGGGNDVTGAKKISMSQVRQVSRVRRSSVDPKADVMLAVKDGGVIYVFLITKAGMDLKGVLGQEKVQRLNQIISKYSATGVQ